MLGPPGGRRGARRGADVEGDTAGPYPVASTAGRYYAADMSYFDRPGFGYLYAAGYKAGRQVADDMGRRRGLLDRLFSDPATEALKQAVRSWSVALVRLQ